MGQGSSGTSQQGNANGSKTSAQKLLPDPKNNGRILYLNMLTIGSAQAPTPSGSSSWNANPFKFDYLQYASGAEAARAVVSDSKAEKMCRQLPGEIQSILQKIGITTECLRVYHRGAFLVMWVSITKVHLETLKAAKSKAKSGRVCTTTGSDGMLDVCSPMGGGTLAAKIGAVLPEKLPEACKDKGINMEVVCCTEPDEASYLDPVLTELGKVPESRGFFGCGSS